VKLVPSELACGGDLGVSTAATHRLASSGIVLSHELIKARRGFTPPARRRSASHSWTPENDMAGDPGTRLSDLAAAAIPPDCRIAQGGLALAAVLIQIAASRRY
jgi:hypothetical protein